MSRRSGVMQRIRDWLGKRALTLVNFDGSIKSRPSASGIDITEENSLEISAVMACVRVLADAIASLPHKLFEQIDGGRVEARMHPLYSILHDMPNPLMTSYTFREVMMLHLLLWGNFYAEIQRATNGRIVALWPIAPKRVKVELFEDGAAMSRRYLIDGGASILSSSRMLHIPGLGFNGYVGLSPIALARDTLGLARATETYGAKFFANDATPGGVLEHPARLKDQAAVDRLRKSFEATHQGSSNARRLAILEEGMTFKQIGIPPEDSQFLQTRKFQIAEIARLFRVPPHLIADVEKSTSWGTGIEQQNIGLVVYTLRPWLVRIEQAEKTQLIDPREQARYYPEFSVEGLLRGDTKSRYESYATARQWGWMSINEIRRSENMDEVPAELGGDLYLTPLNMAPADQPAQPDSSPADRQRSAPETRSDDGPKRAAKRRIDVSRAFVEPLRAAAEKTVKRERSEVLAAVRKATAERNATSSLRDFLNEYYRGEEPPAYIGENLEPVLRALFESIGQLAADEISAPYEAERFGEWIDEYLYRFAWKYAIRSRNQLENLLRKHSEEFEEYITERLDKWVEERPEQIASEERVQVSSEAAKAIWAAAGYTSLVWLAVGDTCEFCMALDGTTVGMSQPFVDEGQSVNGADGGALSPGGAVFTPPVHRGCDCTIGPA